MKNLDKWWSKVCYQAATGIISERLFKKHKVKYEAITKKDRK